MIFERMRVLLVFGALLLLFDLVATLPRNPQALSAVLKAAVSHRKVTGAALNVATKVQKKKKIVPEEVLTTGLMLAGGAAAGGITGHMAAELHNRAVGTHDPDEGTAFSPDNIANLLTIAAGGV
ncbi:hypothetical protein MP638_005578 [Amoeboaphelidium occidentale]|nr:hypothetical protein MP638_005578 [Amoeboaphelidium occidentale]